MKKICLASVIFLFTIISCKKDTATSNDDPDGVLISAAVGGKNLTFNFKVIGDTSHTKQLEITGYNDSVTYNSDYIFINISGPLTPGVYNYNLTDGKQCSLSFMQKSSTGFNPYPCHDATVTVTSVSSTSIKGTFQGTGKYYKQDLNTGLYHLDSTKVIANGKFNIKFGKN